MKQLRIILLAVVLAVVGGLLFYNIQKKEVLSQPSAPEQQIVYTGEDQIFDTLVTQKVWGNGAEEAIRDVSALLQQIEREWSYNRSDSVVSRINADAGIRETILEPEEYTLIEQALKLSSESNGAFAITSASLYHLWGDFSTEPAANEISSALSQLDDTQVVLNPETSGIFLPRPGISISVDLLLPAYAAGQALEIYKEADLDGALLTIGDVQLAFGTESDGTTSMLLDFPGADGEPSLTFAGEGKTAVTITGNILDNQTGYPAETDLAVLTVAEENGVEAAYRALCLWTGGSSTVQEFLDDPNIVIYAETTSGTLLISEQLSAQNTESGGTD